MITNELLKIERIKPTDMVGIMLSGGMDSALLLYLLAKNLTNQIIPFTVPKTDGAKHYVVPIVTWVNNKLNKNIPEPQLIGNPSVYHSQIINHSLKEIEEMYDVLYFAGNSYPENILPGGPNRTKRTNSKHLQPFFELYKTDILRGYITYDIMDLILLTHTCTELEYGRCNVCWQCKEREWAFKELDILDRGIQ
jgi:hypothetical protein